MPRPGQIRIGDDNLLNEGDLAHYGQLLTHRMRSAAKVWIFASSHLLPEVQFV